MAPPVLSLRDVRLGFGGRPLFDGVDLSLNARDRVCLVGRNGGGKSTLLKVMAGLVQPDSGEIFRQPGTSVAYLEQEPDLSGWASLRDYVADGLPEADAHQAHRADSLLEGFGLDPYREPIGLSGGEARRAALARALVGRPDILMLDEPTNHLDLPTVQALEDRLEAFPGAVVLISHDRAFLTRLSRAVLWLDRGRVRRMDEGFAGFEAWRDGIFETEAVEQAKMDKLIAEETRWSRQGISARRKRNQGRLARLYALRKARADQIARPGQMTTEAVAGEKSGALVADLEDVAVSLGGREILSGITLRLMRGDRLGIVGPNGAGKTTLVRLLTGDLAASGGSIRLGTRLEPVIIDQSRSALRPDLSVWDTLCDAGGDHVMVRGQSRHVMGYLREFLFEDRQARSPVGSLSGGERNRLLLAKALAKESNFLVLDEPTNDLDMETLDVLQDVLSDYDGTLLLVSHDRDFIDRVVTSTLVLDGQGGAVNYAGGWQDVLALTNGVLPWQKVTAEAEPKPKAGKKPSGGGASATSSGPKKSAKLSYKDARALEQLPDRIAALEAEWHRLEAVLAAPGAYEKDPAGYAKTADALEALKADHGAAEEQLLELEILKESLEG